jgi:hypothetical protein
MVDDAWTRRLGQHGRAQHGDQQENLLGRGPAFAQAVAEGLADCPLQEVGCRRNAVRCICTYSRSREDMIEQY